jgi:hypothetical protein
VVAAAALAARVAPAVTATGVSGRVVLSGKLGRLLGALVLLDTLAVPLLVVAGRATPLLGCDEGAVERGVQVHLARVALNVHLAHNEREKASPGGEAAWRVVSSGEGLISWCMYFMFLIVAIHRLCETASVVSGSPLRR